MRSPAFRRPIGSAWSLRSPRAPGTSAPAAGSLSPRQRRRLLKLAKRLSRRGLSLRRIAAALAGAGHVNERGQPYNAQSIRAMLRGPQKRKKGNPKAAP